MIFLVFFLNMLDHICLEYMTYMHTRWFFGISWL